MGAFGFFGKYQEQLDIITDGRTASGTRFFGMHYVGYRRTPVFFGYVPIDTNPNTMQLTSVTPIAFNASDLRGSIDITESAIGTTNPVISNFKAGTVRQFIYGNTNSFPNRKTVKYIFHRPEEIKHLTYFSSGSGSGNHVYGLFRVPNFINLKTIYFLNGHLTSASLSGYTEITSIVGKWPEKLEGFHFTNDGGAALTSIQRNFPRSLQHFIFGQNNSTIVSSLLGLLVNCVNLKTLSLTNANWAEAGVISNNSTPITGSIDLTFLPTPLEYFSIANASGLTDIIYNGGFFTTLKRINLYSVTGVNATTLLNILNEFLSSPSGEFINIRLNNKTFAKTFIDSDFKSTNTHFYLHGNIITGNITLTTVRPNIVDFKTGDEATSITTAASKNDFTTVDVSGLTSTTKIDLANSRIANLTLPVNIVCTSLSLGGNKLDVTVNPSLISQISAMTALTSLYLNTGTKLSVNIENGQNSTNGFGSNVDFSALTSLTNLRANNCKLSGTLKIPPSLQLLYIDTNNITGIVTGTISALTEIRAASNTSFDFDFTRVPNIKMINVNGTSVVTIDLSGRTSTSVLGGASANDPFLWAFGLNSLTSIIFPTNPANAIIAVGSVNTILINLCPNLTTLANIENLSYNTITGLSNRSFWANGCALNIDFKFGINNWLPVAIQIQNNVMSNANVDLNIDNIYQNRTKWNTTPAAKSINIAGTNAAPSGIYQAPTGFVLGSVDGTPASAKEQAYVLANNYGWTITMN
jgi:hypothetical protein